MTCLGCSRCETEFVVTLRDGRTVCDMCDDYRHECEVAELVRMRREKGPGWLRNHLEGLGKIRGTQARQRLEVDIRGLWRANRCENPTDG